MAKPESFKENELCVECTHFKGAALGGKGKCLLHDFEFEKPTHSSSYCADFELNEIYKNQSNSWMTIKIFNDWVERLDKEMRNKNKKNLLN